MAWVVIGYDEVLMQDMGDGQEVAVDGALEAVNFLLSQGHHLTVWTERFTPMPDSEKQRLKEQLEQELQAQGFPLMEVWTGSTKPAADVFIDKKAVTYDGDWNLVIAQVGVMLEERGLAPGPQPDDGSMDGIESPPAGEEPPIG
jgi:hypothetical protein